MAEQLPIPVFNSLAEIYPSNEAVLREGERWNELVETFKAQYGHPPTHIVRAPGRVNILGEHIDYSLFPVLPAAIEQDILLALHPTTSLKVSLANIHSHFKPSSFPLGAPNSEGNNSEWHVDFISPAEGGGWENYVKVAMKECLERFFPGGKRSSSQAGDTGDGPRGMELVISGTVPPGSGLSSSAAFVVGSVITFLVANNLTEGISKRDVVAMAMSSEHRMGLRTGGMDQAASALCLSNSLLHISFFPSLSPLPLPLPQSLAIVITNSLTPHDLTDTAPIQYNLRVVESLVAARLLLNAWGLSEHPRLKGKIGEEGRIWLREVLEIWKPIAQGEFTDVDVYEAALGDLERVLGGGGKDKKGWTKDEMIRESGMSEKDFTETYLHHFLEGLSLITLVRADYFQLYNRAKHALTESLRVSRFSSICQEFETSQSQSQTNGKHQTNGSHLSKTETETQEDPRIKELGELLIQSHESCRDIYDCTHPNTDQLQSLCMQLGAIGSRQTGGGWGGAVISLVPTNKAAEFLEGVKGKYEKYKGLKREKVDEAAFATLLGSGAGFYIVDEKGEKGF